jgi:uncharacterized protein DUF4255
MIDQILIFLRNSLNAYLALGRNPADQQEDQVVFYEWKNTDSINFKLGAVSIMLINIEQEKILRAEDRFARTLADGTVQKGQPDVRLNLYLLFVAHFQQYEDSLHYLSSVIQFFQGQPLFDHQNSPGLSENVEHLAFELVSLSFSEQNEIWGALRLSYHPSVLYKAKMIVFRDVDFVVPSPDIEEKILGISE